MERMLSEECTSLMKYIASGGAILDYISPNGKNIDDLLKSISLEILLLEATFVNKTYSMEGVRKEYPKAYMPWSKDEEEFMLRLLVEGRNIEEIANSMQRKTGAILSRIRRIKDFGVML